MLSCAPMRSVNCVKGFSTARGLFGPIFKQCIVCKHDSLRCLRSLSKDRPSDCIECEFFQRGNIQPVGSFLLCESCLVYGVSDQCLDFLFYFIFLKRSDRFSLESERCWKAKEEQFKMPYSR